MRYFYSAQTGGFYPTDIHGEPTIEVVTDEGTTETISNPNCTIPSDAVEITPELYKQLLDGQSSGKRISANSKGLPILTDRPPPTAEQIRAGIIRQIQDIESQQPRAIREAALGYEGAFERLQEIDDKITELRSQL